MRLNPDIKSRRFGSPEPYSGEGPAFEASGRRSYAQLDPTVTAKFAGPEAGRAAAEGKPAAAC